MCVPGCQATLHRTLSRRGMLAAATGFAATAIAPAAAGAEPRRFSSVIDLTHTMSPDFPTFDGSPGIEMQKLMDIKKNGYNLYRWQLIEHAGTHLDAPIHFSETGVTSERIPAETLVVPLAVVDVAAKAAKNPDYLLSRADLAAWEEQHGRLPDNGCVAMNAGWARHVGDKAKYVGKDTAGVMHFPGVDSAAAEWLIQERRIVGLAVDMLSLDHGPSKDFRTHLTWLPSGRWGLENVANLDRVPAVGATLVVGLAKSRMRPAAPAACWRWSDGASRNGRAPAAAGRGSRRVVSSVVGSVADVDQHTPQAAAGLDVTVLPARVIDRTTDHEAEAVQAVAAVMMPRRSGAGGRDRAETECGSGGQREDRLAEHGSLSWAWMCLTTSGLGFWMLDHILALSVVSALSRVHAAIGKMVSCRAIDETIAK